ncbi:hypothetical protein PQR63_22730 [Herbaspirillum rhizosphaerae]|uniref:Uncharacterized protein n=1 Tax=Herbaspirillum rhizosphaerae TaxID=346179 RepID=A0ABW8ZDI8_9BURK
MAIAVNSSFTATIPYVFGGNAPVVDLGQSPGVISTAAALASGGAVVLSLPGAPKGAVTYTASGLLHVLARASAATSRSNAANDETAAASKAFLASLSKSNSRSSDTSVSSDSSDSSGTSASSSFGMQDGVYNGSGVFTPTAGSGVSANFADILSSNPGLSSVAVSSAVAQGAAVGTLVSTSA